MTLHIFNPEHDIALAANLANFTAPHAGRQLRADLDFLPALWAQKGDKILVENPEHAAKHWRRLVSRLVPNKETSCFSQLTFFIISRIIAVFVCEINMRCFLKRDSIT